MPIRECESRAAGNGRVKTFYSRSRDPGYYALISSIDLDFYGGQVKKGEKLGTAISQKCVEISQGDFKDHIQFHLYRSPPHN